MQPKSLLIIWTSSGENSSRIWWETLVKDRGGRWTDFWVSWVVKRVGIWEGRIKRAGCKRFGRNGLRTWTGIRRLGHLLTVDPGELALTGGELDPTHFNLKAEIGKRSPNEERAKRALKGMSLRQCNWGSEDMKTGLSAVAEPTHWGGLTGALFETRHKGDGVQIK